MYIQRNEAGKIIAAYGSKQYSEVDNSQLDLPWLDDDNAELIVFMNPPVIPRSVSAANIRLALLNEGLLDQVNTSAASDETSMIHWYFNTSITRNNPFVLTWSQLLNKTDQQIDDLFVRADALE